MFRAIALACTMLVTAQPVCALQNIPVRTLAPAAVTDSGVLRAASHVRALSGGRVLVNDLTRRRLVMLDSTMKVVTVLADTAAGAPNRMSTASGLIPYMGDSTLYVDRTAQAFTIIGPDGKFGRTMAPPKVNDLGFMSISSYGTPGFDPKGRLIYRGVWRGPGFAGMAPGEFERVADGSNRPIVSPARVDSAPVVRADFDTRAIDTIVKFGLALQKSITVSTQPGSFTSWSAVNPLPVTDEWALMPDGTVAVVRAHDYHVDWFAPDGRMTSTPKMPFDWKRITLEEKVALLDSLKAADEARRAAAPPPPPPVPGGPPRFSAPFTTVDPQDLPDYYPPVRAGFVKASPDNHLWILPTTSTLAQGNLLGGAATSVAASGSGLVYDVVNRSGEIVERVKLPPGRNLAVVAPDGAIYMTYAQGVGRVTLERAHVIR